MLASIRYWGKLDWLILETSHEVDESETTPNDVSLLIDWLILNPNDISMDADVTTIENSWSDEKPLSVFREGVKYGPGIGPGIYDIHWSPRIPSTEEIAERIETMLAASERNILWVNLNCGLKARKYGEARPALSNKVAATKLLGAQLGGAEWVCSVMI